MKIVRHSIRWSAALSLALLALACSSDAPLLAGDGATTLSDAQRSDAGIPTAVPLLPPGQHPAAIVGFPGVLPLATSLSVDAHFAEAIDHGMTVGRVQVDWRDLELTEGQYTLSELETQLSSLADLGLRPMLLLAALDGEALVPDDLQDLLDAGEFVDGDVFTSRFALLLDRVIPMLVQHGGWSITVINEPANYLDDYPENEQARQIDASVNFTAAASDHVHSIDPRIAVTVTFRDGHALNSGAPYTARFLEHCDIASFNFYYGDVSNLTGTPLQSPIDPNGVREEIVELIAIADGKEVVIQEVGLHAGYEDRASPTGTSLDLQRQYLEIFFEEIAKEPIIRTAVWFTMVDFDPGTAELLVAPLRDEGISESFIDAFLETLVTSGLLRFADGSERPAWSSFVEALDGAY